MEGRVTKTSSSPCFSEPSLTFSEKKAHLKVYIYAATGLGSGWYPDQGRDASAPIHTLDIISGRWSQGKRFMAGWPLGGRGVTSAASLPTPCPCSPVLPPLFLPGALPGQVGSASRHSPACSVLTMTLCADWKRSLLPWPVKDGRKSQKAQTESKPDTLMRT